MFIKLIKKGKGHQGTYIKDLRAKPKRGRMEGGRWRENRDNCT